MAKYWRCVERCTVNQLTFVVLKLFFTFILACLLTNGAIAQLKISKISYKVIASSQKDSVEIASNEIVRIKEPNFFGGSPLLGKKLNESLHFDTWKKKKAGLFTAYVTQNWKEISVTTPNHKVKDMDLVAIATALKNSAPRWSSYLVNEQAIQRYTFRIQFTLAR